MEKENGNYYLGFRAFPRSASYGILFRSYTNSERYLADFALEHLKGIRALKHEEG